VIGVANLPFYSSSFFLFSKELVPLNRKVERRETRKEVRISVRTKKKKIIKHFDFYRQKLWLPRKLTKQ
jgi:hypothetical protein